MACSMDSQADQSDEPTLKKESAGGVWGKWDAGQPGPSTADGISDFITDLLWINQSSLHV